MPQTATGRTQAELLAENADLRARLAESTAAEESARAQLALLAALEEQVRTEKALRANAEKFQYVFDNSVVGQSITLPSGEINVNKAFCEMLGYSRAELLSRKWQDLTHTDDIELTNRALTPLLAGNQDAIRFTKRYIHKDGSTIWAEVGTAIRRDAGGKPQYFVTSVNDITRRRRAEENLRQSEALLRLVTDNLPAYVAYVNAPALCYQFVNRQFAFSFQRPREEIIGQPVSSILSQANFEFAWPYIERALHGERCSYETAFPLAEGQRWIQVNYVPSLDQSGKVNGIVILNHDLTERKQAEEALREAEERFHSMFERHHAIMLLIAPHSGAIVDANMAATQFYGYSLDELRRMNIDAINALSPEQVAAERTRALAERQNYFVFPHRLASGEIRTVEVHSTPIAVGEQQLLFSIIHDITERQQAEAALAASQAMYRLLAENSSDAVTLIDAGGNVVYASPSCTRRLGYDENDLLQLDTPGIMQLVYPDDRAAIAAEIRRGRELKLPTSRYEYRLRTKSGDYIWVEDVLRRTFDEQGFVSTIVNSRDITERKQAAAEHEHLQAQLAEAQKMELVGRLAGGIAHEFNNMLAGILLRTELLLYAAEPDTPLQRGLTTIYSVSQRAAEMVRSLLGFARRQVIAPRMLDLNVAVQSSLPMLHKMVGEEIAVVWQPGSHIWPVKIDPTQFEQILINLCANARDAIAGIGVITIETAALELAHARDVGGHDVPSGVYVLLAVTDTGCGMDQALLAHIFEPFFTTKEVGKGSGLGLAAVAGIVQQNGGYIQILTEPGVGTTFKIYLPWYTETVASGEQDQTPSLPYGHEETVLLVEDEAVVLQMTADALQYLGYHVIAAATPEEAIQQVEKLSGTVNLLMTDVVMPVMNGGELAERVAVIQPGIKRLFISGYPSDIVAQRGALGDDVHFLQKPFTLQELATKMRAVLAEAAPIKPG